MKVKDFIKYGLESDEDLKRKEIRMIKKEIRYIQEMKKEVEKKTETEILEMVKGDKKVYDQYLEMSKMIEDKNKAEITRMQKEGKLREVFLDKDGKIMEEENGEKESGPKEVKISNS